MARHLVNPCMKLPTLYWRHNFMDLQSFFNKLWQVTFPFQTWLCHVLRHFLFDVDVKLKKWKILGFVWPWDFFHLFAKIYFHFIWKSIFGHENSKYNITAWSCIWIWNTRKTCFHSLFFHFHCIFLYQIYPNFYFYKNNPI